MKQIQCVFLLVLLGMTLNASAQELYNCDPIKDFGGNLIGQEKYSVQFKDLNVYLIQTITSPGTPQSLTQEFLMEQSPSNESVYRVHNLFVTITHQVFGATVVRKVQLSKNGFSSSCHRSFNYIPPSNIAVLAHPLNKSNVAHFKSSYPSLMWTPLVLVFGWYSIEGTREDLKKFVLENYKELEISKESLLKLQ